MEQNTENKIGIGYPPYQNFDPGRTWYYVPGAQNYEGSNVNLLTASYASNSENAPYPPYNPQYFSQQNIEKSDHQKAMIKQMAPPSKVLVDNTAEFFEHIDVLPNSRYFCRVCTKTYKSNTTVNSHIRSHHIFNETMCNEPGCDHVAYTLFDRRKHQKIHDKLSDHRDKKLKRVYSNEIAPLPMPCEKVLREEILKNNKNIEGMVKSMDASEKGKVTYTCVTCGNVFHNSFHATRHTEHHSENPRKCFYCGDVRRGNVDLRVHYLRKHKEEGTRTFACSGCYKEFTSLDMYREHQRYKTVDNLCRKRPYVQNVYYGELPNWVAADPITQKRIDNLKKKFQVAGSESDDSGCGNLEELPVLPAGMSPLFVQTEFGLKHYEDLSKNSMTYRARSEKTYLEENCHEKNENIKHGEYKMQTAQYHENHQFPQQNTVDGFYQNCSNFHCNDNDYQPQMAINDQFTAHPPPSVPVRSPEVNMQSNDSLNLDDGMGMEYNTNGICEMGTQNMMCGEYNGGFGAFENYGFGMPSTSNAPMFSDPNSLSNIF